MCNLLWRWQLERLFSQYWGFPSSDHSHQRSMLIFNSRTVDFI
jgi:hypothetical protein